MSLPLLVRPGTLLALGAHDDRPDYDYLEGVELRAYELADGATATAVVPTLAGGVAATFTARREGERVTITREKDSSTDGTD
jgi:alpha-D-xyloside xylohydrolase